MATLNTTTQSVIDAINSRAGAGSATPGDMLYLAKAVQTLVSGCTSLRQHRKPSGAPMARRKPQP